MSRARQGFFKRIFSVVFRRREKISPRSLQLQSLEGRFLLDVGFFPGLDNSILESSLQQLPDQGPQAPQDGQLGIRPFSLDDPNNTVAHSTIVNGQNTHAGPGQYHDIEDTNPWHDTWDWGGGPGGGNGPLVQLASNPTGPFTTYLITTDDPGVMQLSDGRVIYYDDADILAIVLDANGQVANVGIYFDGSDVGLEANNPREDIRAFTIDSQGNIYIALKGKGLVNTPRGNLVVGVNDILKFTPTSLGANTAGTWEWYFDGSDVGLFGDDERIDGLSFLPNGDLVMSIHEDGWLPGVGRVGESDLIRFQFTSQGFGTTSGTWSLWQSGASMGFDSYREELDALWVAPDGDRVGFSAEEDYQFQGIHPQNEDLMLFRRSSGTVSVLLNTTPLGMRFSDVVGMHVMPGDALAGLGSSGGGQTGGGEEASGGSGTSTTGTVSTYLVSMDDPGTIRLPGGGFLSYDDSDIVAMVVDDNGHLVNAAIFFDGSDVGLTTDQEDIKAFTMDDQGNLYIALKGKGFVNTPQGGLVVGVNDIIKFTPTSLGNNTAGTWEWFFDGSDVGLFGDDERIDGLSFLPNGNLVLSIHEQGSVPGVGTVHSGDLLEFAFTTQGFGTTAGTWSLWQSRSGMGLDTPDEELRALHVSQDGNRVIFTAEDFRHGGIRADDEDLLVFKRGTGTVGVFLNATPFGLRLHEVDAVMVAQGDVIPGLSSGTPTVLPLRLDITPGATTVATLPQSQDQSSVADQLLPQIDDRLIRDDSPQGFATPQLPSSNQHTGSDLLPQIEGHEGEDLTQDWTSALTNHHDQSAPNNPGSHTATVATGTQGTGLWASQDDDDLSARVRDEVFREHTSSWDYLDLASQWVAQWWS